MTDRGEAGLRGPVKTCQVERDCVYQDHHWVMHTSTVFAEDGQLLEQRHRNPDGTAWRVVCHYDDRGRISRKEYFHEGPDAKQVLLYEYDSPGRLERVRVRSENGEERVAESYTYDRAGRKAATVYPDPAQRNASGLVTEALETSPGASAILTLFDEQDRPERRVFYDPNGIVERRVVMRYDADGRLLEEGEREPDGSIREDFRTQYRYDAAGRVIEKEFYWSAIGRVRDEYVYNPEGDVVENRHESAGGFAHPDGDQKWTVRSRYLYDDRGNWVERIEETTPQGGEQRISMIERRRIEYY